MERNRIKIKKNKLNKIRYRNKQTMFCRLGRKQGKSDFKLE